MWPFGFFLHPAILWIILLIVARHEADRSYSKLFFVSLGIVIAAFGFNWFISPWDLVATPVVCALVLRRFCYVTWPQAIISTVLFVGWWAAYPLLWRRFIQ